MTHPKVYEWKLEVLDSDGGEDPDIIDFQHFGTFAAARLAAEREPAPSRICLVQDTFHRDDTGELLDRRHAYIVDGRLGDFEALDGGGKPPRRFADEVRKAER